MIRGVNPALLERAHGVANGLGGELTALNPLAELERAPWQSGAGHSQAA
jgi:hypothetical protein